MQFEKESEFVKHIKDHTVDIFGEPICWDDPAKKSTLETGTTRSFLDLTGTDRKDNLVFVEVKLLKYKSDGWSDRLHKAVGQLLHYTYCSLYPKGKNHETLDEIKRKIKDIRLFIVCETRSESVKNLCRMLQAFGINIKHRYVNQGENT